MIHLVTGGSGSGKSAYAEQCILDFGGTRRVYIATMQPFGAEGQARIARHRKMRAAKQFSTIECYTNLKEVELEPGSDVLLECMSNLTANEIFDPSINVRLAEMVDCVTEVVYGIPVRIKKE